MSAQGESQSALPVSARIGYRLAQVGAAAHILGGTLDLRMSRLLPFHEEFLGFPAGETPAPIAALTLALLHALGASLVAGGVTMLLLLPLLRASRKIRYALAIVVVAMGCEGMVGIQMLGLGLHFGAIPLSVASIVLVGVALFWFSARPIQEPRPD